MMKRVIMRLLVVGLGAASAQAAISDAKVHFSFDPTTTTTWDVNVTVTGADTLGLAQYSIWVDNVNPTLVNYTENILGTVNGSFSPIGFVSSNLVAGPVGASFNAGNFQNAGTSAIQGIGKVAVNEPGPIPGTTPLVDLGVPALLGTLTTPAGLGVGDFRATSANVLNTTNDGVVTPDLTFNVTPEPATMMLLTAAGLLLGCRKYRYIDCK